MRLAEIIVQALDHRVADLIERVHFLLGLGVVLGKLEASCVKCVPAAVAARKRHRRGLADMANAERINKALQRNVAPRLDGVEQIAHRDFAEAFDVLKMDFLVALLQRENVGRFPDPFLFVKQLDLLFAEPVDIEGATGDEVLEMPDRLIRTGKFAGAVNARALGAAGDDLAHYVGVQRAWALAREFVRLGPARTLVLDHAQHLRDDVAGTLDLHGVALAHVEPRDLAGIVQRRILHHDAADGHRLKLGDGCEEAGAADLDLDVLNDGGGFFGGEFMRDRPARRSRHEAEPLLPIEPVDFIDDAVDIVVEAGAPDFDVAVELQQFVDRAAHLGQRIGFKTAMLEPFDHAGLRVRRHGAHLAPGVSEETERPRRGDRRIELAQRAGGSVARIDVELLAGLRLLAVKVEERGLGHVDFAAHLAHRRYATAFQPVRNVLQRLHIGGDILAFGAVAARRAGDELAFLVAQRHRQAVDLRLGGECDLLVLRQTQKAADAADEIDDVFFGKGIVERQHRHRVADLGESRRGRRADPLRQAFQRAQLRKARLDRVVALAQRVIGRIRNGRRILLIIAAVMLGDFGLQPHVLAPWPAFR